MKTFYSDKIVLSNEVAKGSILVEDGMIAQIIPGAKPEGDFVDLSGKFVLPGFINLASKEYQEETKSSYNKHFSECKVFRQMDKRLAESGVTTNFHTFNLEELLQDQSIEEAIAHLEKIKNSMKSNRLVDHKIHVVFRLGGSYANKNLRKLIMSGVVDFLTCTGYHSRDDFNYRNQYFVQSLQHRFELDDDEAAQAMDILTKLREESALDELSYRIKSARSHNLPFASNRFNLVKKLKDEYKINVDIISGEHSRKTLNLIKENQMHYLYAIENFSKGFDDVDFMELMSEKIVDIVTTNARTHDILEYIFGLEGTLGLPDTVKLFSYYPAAAMKLDDRGEIAVGKRADFVAVEMQDEMPALIMTVSGGDIVVQYNYK